MVQKFYFYKHFLNITFPQVIIKSVHFTELTVDTPVFFPISTIPVDCSVLMGHNKYLIHKPS